MSVWMNELTLAFSGISPREKCKLCKIFHDLMICNMKYLYNSIDACTVQSHWVVWMLWFAQHTHTHRHRKCIHSKFNSIFQTSDLHARVIQSAIYYHRAYTAVFILLFRIGSEIHALFAIMLVFSRFCDAYNKIDDFNASKQKKRKDVMHLAEIVWFCVRAKKSDFPSNFAFKKKKKTMKYDNRIHWYIVSEYDFSSKCFCGKWFWCILSLIIVALLTIPCFVLNFVLSSMRLPWNKFSFDFPILKTV